MIAAALAMQPAIAFAEPGFSNQMRILSVHVREGFVDLHTEAVTSPMGCIRQDILRIGNSTLNADKMFAAALSAQAQGRPVNAWVYSCDSDGISNITTLWVK